MLFFPEETTDHTKAHLSTAREALLIMPPSLRAMRKWLEMALERPDGHCSSFERNVLGQLHFEAYSHVALVKQWEQNVAFSLADHVLSCCCLHCAHKNARSRRELNCWSSTVLFEKQHYSLWLWLSLWLWVTSLPFSSWVAGFTMLYKSPFDFSLLFLLMFPF